MTIFYYLWWRNKEPCILMHADRTYPLVRMLNIFFKKTSLLILIKD